MNLFLIKLIVKINKIGNFPFSGLTNLFSGMSPMHLLRETTSNSRWLEDNLNDFSLTSLLGHLDEINASRDIVVSSIWLFYLEYASYCNLSLFLGPLKLIGDQ